MSNFHEIVEGAGRAVPPRGARLPAFLGLGCDAGARLDGLKVVIVGTGSVGRPVALHLARQQIAALWLLDRSRYKDESLLNQPIEPSDLGEAKASATGRMCKRLSPRTRIFACDQPVQSLDEAALAEADAWILATDNLAAEVDVGQRCLHHGKTLLHASVHGDTLTAQVRTFAGRQGKGPCPACAFGPHEWDMVHRETVFSCDGWSMGKSVGQTQAAPTMSVSFLCTLAADLAMTQLFRLTLGLGVSVEDTLLEYCGYTHKTVISPLKRNPDCPCDHQSWTKAQPPRPLAEMTPRGLCAAAGMPPEESSFLLGGLTFLDEMPCGFCGRLSLRRRFVPTEGDMTCPECRQKLRPSPFHCHRPVPPGVLAPVLDRPLRELSTTEIPWVLVRGSERALLFRPTEGENS